MTRQDSRLMCELNDLIALYEKGDTEALRATGHLLIRRLKEMMDEAFPEWEKHHKGVEIGECLVLSALCSVLIEPKDDKRNHNKDCLLIDVL